MKFLPFLGAILLVILFVPPAMADDVDRYIADLKDQNSTIRADAAKALGEAKDPRAVDPLIQTLNDDDYFVRSRSAIALGKIGDSRAFDPLIMALKDDDNDIRIITTTALGYLKEPRAVEPLIQMLNDGDRSVRSNTALVLGKINDTRAVDPLIKTLKNDEFVVQYSAVQALGWIGDHRAVDPLILALKDESFYIREEAAKALGKIEDARAVDPLIQALKDNVKGSEAFIREAIVIALGKLNDTSAVDPIIHSLKDDDASVREKAAAVLGDLKDPRAVDPLIQSLKDDDPNVRIAAEGSLGWIGDSRALDPLILTLQNDENGSVRIDAVNALGWFAKKDARVVDPLIQALNDPDWGVRTMASTSLSLSRDPRAVEPVIQALKDENSSVRYNAAVSLGLGLNDPRAVNPLIQLLQDEDYSVRWAAARSLGELNDTRAVDPLVQALKDDDHSVQEEAAAALEKLGWQEDGKQAFVELGTDTSGDFSSSDAKMTSGVSSPLGSGTNINGPKAPVPGSIIAEGEVGTAGGQVESPDGLTVEFPEGALSSDESITIKRAEDAPANTSFYFIERQGSGLLSKSANVTLPLPQGSRQEDAFVMQEISGDIWVVLPSKYVAASGKLTAQASHFSGIGVVDPSSLGLVEKDYVLKPNTLIIRNEWGWNPIKLAYRAIESTKDLYKTAGVDQSVEVMAGSEATFQIWWAASGGNAVNDKDDVITAFFDKNTGDKIGEVRGRVESQSFLTEIGEKPPERTYVPVPRSILMLADELTMARNFYKSAGYNVPEAIPVRVFQLDKPDVAGYWDPVRKYLDINVEFMVSSPEKNRSRRATIAHEYWHAICTKNSYVNSRMPWLEEAFGVAWESEVFPGCNDYVDLWHPWSTVGQVLGSGFLNSRTEEDPVGNKGDRTKRGYDLWPWAKYLIHKQTSEDIIDISSGKMDPGVLRELFVQFTRSLLIKKDALDDPAPQEPAMSNPPGVVVTGWSRKNLVDIVQRDYLQLGQAKLPDWLSSSRPLSFNLLKVKDVPVEKPLAKGELQPPDVVVRRKSIDPKEQIIALSPVWPKSVGKDKYSEKLDILRSEDDLIIGDGGIVIPAGWMYEKAQQKEGKVTLPVALVGTSMDSGKASPLLIYRLQPPTDIRVTKKGDKVGLTWKLPDLGKGLKPSDCLAGYRLFVRTKNGVEKMIPDQLIAPDKTSFEVAKSKLSEYTALGLASQDAAITDQETGQPEISEIFWYYSGVWVLSDTEEIPVSKASFTGYFNSGEDTQDQVIQLFGGLSFCMREQTLSVSRNSITSRLRWDNLCIPISDRPYQVRNDWNCSISSTNTWSQLPSMLTPDTLLNITLAFTIEGPCVKDYSWADFNWIPRVDTTMSVGGYDIYYPGIDPNKFPDAASIEAPKPLKVESYKVPEGKEGAQLFLEIVGDGVAGVGGYNYTYTYQVSPGPKEAMHPG